MKTDTGPIILVLEDMEPRVTWLKSTFPDVEIIWEATVDGFISKLKLIDVSRLALFLLDHDLGGPFEGSSDQTGKSGLDAVNELGPWSNVPAIVWSINYTGAMNMVKTLNDHGFIVTHIPFHHLNFSSLAAAIGSQVSS